MKIDNNLRSNLLHRGIIESSRAGMKESTVKPEAESMKPVEDKGFKNPEPSALKGFNIDRLA